MRLTKMNASTIIRVLRQSRQKRREIHSDIKDASAEAVRRLDEDVKSLMNEYKSLREALLHGNIPVAVNVIVIGDYVKERKVN